MTKIAVLAGDGIGPEITAQAVRVVEALGRHGLKIDIESAPVGGTADDSHGDPLPATTLKVCESAQAVLFGAVGGPRYDTLPRPMRPEQALLRLRKHFDLFANLRPAIVYPELAHASTLRADVVAGLDLLILRELTSDIYFGQPRGIHRNERGEREGFDTMRYNETEIARIARWGFEAARKRQRRLCSVDKANVLETPIHGSAPDIAGTGAANPLATILSLAMLLRYSLEQPEAADRVERAVRAVLGKGLRTADIAREGEKRLTCSEMGDAVVAAL